MNIKALVVLVILISIPGRLSAKPFIPHAVALVNKTKEKIGVIALNRPFHRIDATKLNLVWLKPNQKTNYLVRGRVLGFWKRGALAQFSIVDKDDKIIFFLNNKGSIKTIHGKLKEIDVSNTKTNDVRINTKNPRAGRQNCVKCAEDCYDADGTLKYCACIDSCWDRTRDLEWVLEPGEMRTIRVPEASDIGILEETMDFDDDGCVDEQCIERTITTTTEYYLAD